MSDGVWFALMFVGIVYLLFSWASFSHRCEAIHGHVFQVRLQPICLSADGRVLEP